MKTSILTLICFAFSIVCHGKQLNDSVLVNATFNDSSFLDKKPELVVQKSGANDTIRIKDYKNILLKNSELAQAIRKSNKKFIYISLWASWCVPCRTHSKELLKADLRNIEVIGLSLDKDNNAMKKAIEADKIGIWQHIQLKEGFDAEIVKRFGITSIPENILLDENRNVVGINISDNALTSIIIKNTVIYNKASKSF